VHRQPRAHKISLSQVIDAVAVHHSLTVEDLIGTRRSAEKNIPRQIGMFLSRELTGASLPQIGMAFGGRKHSTVIHACNALESQMRTDSVLAARVEDIRRRIVEGR
jgi:chromosomal replication initiator protein